MAPSGQRCEPVEYNVRDLIIYALGIGSRDLRYVYEKDPNFAAFPTFPVALYYKGTSFDVLPFPSPILDAFPVPEVSGVKVWLDAGITIERFAELPSTGGRFTLEGGVASLQPKGKGALMEKLYDVKDESGKTYYRMVDVSYLVGAHDVDAFGTTLTVPVDVTKAVGSRAPTWRVEETMEAGVACVYRLSGDYNPLHLDPGYAKSAGYEHPIVHGKCTLGHAARMLLNTLAGGDHRRFRSLQLRYASPVIPGQTLVTEIWDLSSEEFLFQVLVKETGKVCVSNGSVANHFQKRFRIHDARAAPRSVNKKRSLKSRSHHFSAAYFAAGALPPRQELFLPPLVLPRVSSDDARWFLTNN